MKHRRYSLRRSRHILKQVYAWYKKKSQQLSVAQVEQLEEQMASLDQALLSKNKEDASTLAHQLEAFSTQHCKKSFFEYGWEIVVALAVALVIATVVRQMWFEPYEIPTGSMRPTFREQDHLVVTKTAFGLNVPLETQHFYFDPSLVQRTSILIFSGDGIPLPDTDSTYFGIFPYKKRYIKRLIGKPGDSIYFYGGRLYGVDKEGKEIVELRDSPWMQPLEYVPFLSFEGELSLTGDRSSYLRSIVLKQMHEPAGKITFSPAGVVQGEVFNGKDWVKDDPMAQASPHDAVKTYSDLLGIRNYAVARLLTKEQLKQIGEDSDEWGDGVLYLQLHHTPSLTAPKPILYQSGIGIPAYSTVIPLKQEHLDAIMDHLYTARFVVNDGKAYRYSASGERIGMDNPSLPGVPNGTYEFYHGIASKVMWAGILTDVSKESSLYSRDPAYVQKMFNYGIDMTTILNPSRQNQTLFPHRYAYFRDGDLYLMGAPILKKDDPTLIAFKEREDKRQQNATTAAPYVAFRDYGPPLKEGGIDVDFIRTFGVSVPEQRYLVLGDNHAMSSDSRVFGFVPQNNLQGAPCWIFWPPGDRLGSPPQKPYPFMNTPRAIVWGVVGIIALIWFSYHRYRIKRPIFKKIKRL